MQPKIIEAMMAVEAAEIVLQDIKREMQEVADESEALMGH